MISLLKGSKERSMGSAARLRATFALLLALVVAGPEPQAVAIEKDRLVPAGRLVIEGRRLSCGSTKASPNVRAAAPNTSIRGVNRAMSEECHARRQRA